MASIIQKEEQLTALNTVFDLVRNIQELNTLLICAETRALRLVGVDKFGSQKTDLVYLEEPFSDKLVPIVEKQREAWIREVRQICAKNRIALDQDEEKAMGDFREKPPVENE